MPPSPKKRKPSRPEAAQVEYLAGGQVSYRVRRKNMRSVARSPSLWEARP